MRGFQDVLLRRTSFATVTAEATAASAADSALAWVGAHGGPHADTPVTLDGKDILLEGSSGEVKINVDGQFPNVIVIRAQLTFTGRQVVRTTRWAAPP